MHPTSPDPTIADRDAPASPVPPPPERTVRIEDGVPWIGDRSFPWASKVQADDRYMDEQFPFRLRRFRLTFENGWTLSIVFGSGAYCANYDVWRGDRPFMESCPDAEVGAWVGEGELLPWDDGDTVKGSVPADDLLRLIDQAMTWPSDFPEGAVLTLNGIREVAR